MMGYGCAQVRVNGGVQMVGKAGGLTWMLQYMEEIER